jgi:hypothetical protein
MVKKVKSQQKKNKAQKRGGGLDEQALAESILGEVGTS